MTHLRTNPDVTAWLLILAGSLAHECIAASVLDDKMLSHGFARAAKRSPVLTHGLLVMTVLHLLGVVPTRLDAYQGFGIMHPGATLRRVVRRGE